MGTLTAFLQSARYDLLDYGTGLEFDNTELLDYLNRMITVMDSTLVSVRSELMQGQETAIDCVAYQDYIDLTYMNNGQWDHIHEVWIGQNKKTQISLTEMNYRRMYVSGTAEPQFWTLKDNRLLWECECTSAYDNVLINYYKKTRPLLLTYSSAFTANATTDVLTMTSGNHTFVTGDGPFTVSNSGGALPTGLAASTNYYCIFDPADPDGMRLATTKAAALGEKEYRETSQVMVLVLILLAPTLPVPQQGR